MAKPRSDDPRDNMVATRFSDAELKRLDKKRGGLSRSEFIRTKTTGRR